MKYHLRPMAVHTAPTSAEADTEGDSGEDKHQGLGPIRRITREVGLALITLGVIVLLFAAYQLWGTGLAEAHSQSALKKSFNAAVAAHQTADSPTVGPGSGSTPTRPTTPVSRPASAAPAPGGALDHLVIPRIGLDAFVVQGVGEEDLRRGPGHYPQTVLPGQNGNAAIAGHRTTYGAPFYSLNELKVGDPISLTDTEGRTFVYRVSALPRVVSPDDVSVLDATPFPQLTLTTCNPRFSATSRLVVTARLTGRPPLPATPAPAQTAPAGPGSPAAGRPAGVAAADTLGSGQKSAWPPALLYGGLVILLWIGTRLWINRTRRWARVAAYVVGIGVCLIPLWFCFENVVRLLPQSI
jgi:sortase A